MADPQNHLLITSFSEKCPRNGEAEMLRHLSFRSLGILFHRLVYGINSNLLGPTLLDLKEVWLRRQRLLEYWYISGTAIQFINSHT
jgi:hypothetical protein